MYIKLGRIFESCLEEKSMHKFTPFPVIESGMREFNGYYDTVEPLWKSSLQKFSAFRLISVDQGRLNVLLDQNNLITLSQGESVIISPDTVHRFLNSTSQSELRYYSMCFNIDNLKLTNEIMRDIANSPIQIENPLSKIVINLFLKFKEIALSAVDSEIEKDILCRIELSNFLLTLMKLLPELSNSGFTPYSEKEVNLARKIANLIDNEFEHPNAHSMKIRTIFRDLNISVGYGYQIFTNVYNKTPFEYVEEKRYEFAKELLINSNHTIQEIGYLTKCGDLSNFSKKFKKWSGKSPREFRKAMKK